MKRNWYLVAHRSGARVFEQVGVAPELSLVSSFDNPDGKLKERAFTTDREGRTPQTKGTGYNQFSVEQTQRDNVAEHFARHIAGDLKAQSSKFDYLVLVAEPQLMGKLRDQLDKNLTQKVRASLSKDLAHVTDREISQHLSEVLFVKEPIA